MAVTERQAAMLAEMGIRLWTRPEVAEPPAAAPEPAPAPAHDAAPLSAAAASRSAVVSATLSRT